MHRGGGVATLTALAFTAASCGSLAPDSSAVVRAATAFRSAVQQSDGTAACWLLSPQTVHEVAQSAGKPCPAAIVGEAVGGQGGPVHVDVYGQGARVVFADDVVFLADFPAGWRLTAAGCTPRGDKPYDCVVKG